MANGLSPEAEIDLDDIWLFVAKASGNFDIADRVIHGITETIWLLSRHPELGRSRDADFGAGIRSIATGSYVILYRVREGEALVLRILRGSRDIPSLL